ncbi:MAG TPA: cytochrome P450 [Baekduia sp.]
MIDKSSDRCPVVDFDHHSPEHAEDPWEAYRLLREQCPVAETKAHGGFKIVTRYEDVAAIAADWRTFSSDHDLDGSTTGYLGVTIPSPPVRGLPTEVDPPEHTEYRKILKPLFDRRAVEERASRLAQIVDDVIDEFIEAGSCDLIDDVTAAVPAAITLEFLGMPVADWRRYADPMHKIVYAPQDTPEYAEAIAGNGWILEQVAQEVQRRRDEGDERPDVLGHLMRSSIGAVPLSDQQLLDLAWLIIVGGLDNTSSVLALALLHLYRNPAERDRLRGDVALSRTAFHEYLRFFAVTQAMSRTATRDTEVAGVPVAEGDRVLISFAAANRDPGTFEDPDEIVLDRKPNKHLGFGIGAHRCVGALLAEEMFVIAMQRVLERMPDYAVDESVLRPYPSAGIAVGYIEMPATFTPGPRRS